ncbi:hypothetical protein I551_0308 [Mycobacterium ulcerans str. Harvey]|uniref:TobH protein n=1 Tax=Mycobacterium ulcerans str. Harvey TaxID=1299332 RepID=A0ABN0R7X6_MYCUL|nr:hypothetical protein I551_0308 [Mycobacterium ulcerans str. Harvey]
MRAASTAGAQVRAIAAASDEGELDSLNIDDRPRTVIWVPGRAPPRPPGHARRNAGATVGAPITIATEAPPWVGPLDVMVVAGDDPGDPALVGAAAMGVRRGARVVVAAPTRATARLRGGSGRGAGTAVVGSRRIRAVPLPGRGLAVLRTVAPKLRIDLAALADDLDAETLCNSAGREVFTNPAKALAARISGRRIVLAADGAATLALARHGSSALLRIAHQVTAATWLADAVVALRAGAASGYDDGVDALFHDEEIDGPRPEQMRVLALTLAAERTVVGARVAGLDNIDLIAAEDAAQVPGDPAGRRLGPCAGSDRRTPCRTTTGSIGRSPGDGCGVFATRAGIGRRWNYYAERYGHTRGDRAPPSPSSPVGRYRPLILRPNSGSARTPETRPGWKPMAARARCSRRCPQIRRDSLGRRTSPVR